jgi:hypothetical protein
MLAIFGNDSFDLGKERSPVVVRFGFHDLLPGDLLEELGLTVIHEGEGVSLSVGVSVIHQSSLHGSEVLIVVPRSLGVEVGSG